MAHGSEQPWVEKYRPAAVSDVVSQGPVVSVLSRVRSQGSLPHMLFCGPPGTGKTSAILALSRELFGAHMRSRVLELNASDERGIDVVREKVKSFARLAVSSDAAHKMPPFKIVILDEADSMTADAQAALRRIIEAHSKITRFVLICNYVSRIIEPLASRCAKLRFKPIGNDAIVERLAFICGQENLSARNDQLEFVAKVAGGDLRRAITILQTIKRIDDAVSPELVAEVAGVIPENVMLPVVQAWIQKDVLSLEASLKALIRLGYSGMQFINQLVEILPENPHLPERQKNLAAVMLGQTDRALVDGADEHLQVLRLLLTTMA